MKKIILLVFLSALFLPELGAQTNYAVKLAETIMDQYKDSMVVMKYASHLEQDNLIQPGQTVEDAQKSRPANWNYEIGVVLMGFERLVDVTGDKTTMIIQNILLIILSTEEGTSGLM